MHPAKQTTILIGEDESEIRNYLETTLRCRGYRVRCAADGEEVLKQLACNDDVNAVLLDIMMPRKDGFGALREIRRTQPNLPVIMLSALGSTTNVVEAMKSGATDFLTKPVNHEEVWRAVDKAVMGAARNASAEAQPDSSESMFFGDHPAIQEIRALLPRVGMSDLPVLIQGETGCGKEVLARQIHAQSDRAEKPFIKLNCAAIPSELIESELFGYERGAFTGAFQRKTGLLELANGGTLLLDEIGDMDVRLQAKLLHVLQDHEFRRIGGKEDLKANVRFIAATHRDLEAAIGNNTFRQDLYFRLNCMTFRLPALRERRDEVEAITRFLLRRHAQRDESELLTPELIAAMKAYDWPGNIRELESAVRKLLALRDPSLVTRDLRGRNRTAASQNQSDGVAVTVAPPGPSAILGEVTRAKELAEADAIIAVLNSTRWNRKQAAALLDIDYKALLYKMKKLSIDQRTEVAG